MKSLFFAALLAPATLVAQTAATPASAPAAAPATPTNHWVADPVHSEVAFRVRHLGITWVNGTFGQWTADIDYDPAKPEAASVVAKLATASITTGNDRRDTDLRQNYLAADSFPEISFTSTKVERTAPDHLRIAGNLTIRGITHPVVLETDIGGVFASSRGRRTAFSATTSIKRQDYGISLNRFMEGAQIVGDDVKITIDVEAIERQKERSDRPSPKAQEVAPLDPLSYRTETAVALLLKRLGNCFMMPSLNMSAICIA